MSQHVVVDVQAAFLGHDSMSDIIKEIGKLCLRRDPNLPKRLTDSQRASAHQHPDIISAEQAKVELQKQISLARSSSRQAADSPEGIEFRRHCQRIRAMKYVAGPYSQEEQSSKLVAAKVQASKENPPQEGQRIELHVWR